ncbi:uncharacterized protein TRIADDRAFT_34128 [Trichoplax adhaerens]|uniref:DNA polymerase n=1 Tax=Trichoplax adhaerens TaxID=10228 RepID=B3SDS4_TRIAD|nr:hypothetical protein TRIADDRAFT_34128 [Trichoplax adhaerens]EDV19126.1 hypothetical protein TRIADDRAFT_34128 [Trichoplax adhaerens]|eukprot:XP_002118387.1 hypothetical protein TRIADDRAFT_34128 [Trichoplax adhaerens]
MFYPARLNAIYTVLFRWDPDILVGYEIQMLSWGYLLQRSKSLQIDLATLLSRVPSVNNKFQLELENDFQANYKTDVFIVGRVIVNIWRIMRYEVVALRSYTFESVIDHVLHRRHALHTFRSLTDWFHDDRNRWRTIEYYIIRCRGNWRLLETFDMIDRSSEFARLYGIQFYSVLSRGSQFRIESMLLRLAKPMNYIPVSVSEKQRTWMKAPEVIPLVMEPESRFYSNPVLVLDFQSLYPSVMIAYNYCYTTCLGRISGIATDKEFKFGCTSHQVPLSLLKKLRNDISIAPCGAVYVKDHIRKGVIPRMLKEILDTRIMIKRAMKDCKDNKSLHRLLDIRQFGLKMIANVTYGYAGATFSGRMPLIELADSIVSKARETLERAIKIVNTTSKWNARVVYGDTDSMFVLLEGATKARAFEIGREIAETITSMNPKPVALKFEKVFLPSLLITKKRYVGYAYESADQKEPTFDAKGIETVRRDGCPAVSKIMEKAIRILFSRRDMSLVKKYVLHKCRMLIEGKVAINDYVIAKEYRGKSTYKPGACVPALEITKQLLAHDRRSEPRIGERVPYVIVYGVPGVPLIRLVRRPRELLNDPNLRLNATYYITKQILPALDRLLSLIGIDVESWHAELPRSIRSDVINQSQFQVAKQGVISQYFSSLHCLVCEEMTVDGVCPSCIRDSQKAIMIAQQRISDFERKNRHLKEICCNCIGQRVINAECISLDCPILFETKRNQRDVDCIPRLREFISKISTIACSSIAEAQITG